jgi:hypothetical protein
MDAPPAESPRPDSGLLGNDFARPQRARQAPMFAPLPGGWWRRFGFRLIALYVGLFVAGTLADFIPVAGWAGRIYEGMWKNFVPWFARVVLQVSEPVVFKSSGSGDKLFDWVQAAAMLTVALIGALGWSVFDRARRWDGWARDVTHIAARYFLGAMMLSYGIAKILHLQMPGPDFPRLLEPYGESSPMGLAWTFVGLSWAYSAFAGGLEFLGGALLFFRRTTALGALLTAAVMTNVLMMNLCFDIPVKLFSAQLLFLALLLAAPKASRLCDVLVWHRTSPPEADVDLVRRWPTGRAGRLFTVVKVLIVLLIFWGVAGQRTWTWLNTPAPARSPLYGLYEVTSFKRDGETRPPLLTDALRWRRVAINDRNLLWLVSMDDRGSYYRLKFSSNAGSFTLQAINGRDQPLEPFTFRQVAPDQLVLEGKFGGARLVVELRRADEIKLRLINRGFHWVSEVPFNK